MATYTLALINNHEDGKLFFDTYNIPYQIITRGTNAGKLRVKQSRSYDSSKVLEVRRLLTEQGYGILCDHSNVFRDENERTVVTFSPYHDISPDVAGEIYLPGYMIITGLFEPPVRNLRATIPDIESQSKIMILLLPNYLMGRCL